MTCPSCGAETSSGSNFCKLCGISLSSQPASERRLNPARLAGMFWAVTALILGSFGILFGTALPMVLAGIDGGVIIPIVGLGAGTTMIVASMLIRQLSRLITMMQNYSSSPPQRSLARASAPQSPQLAAPFSGSPSITEHTTRNFDPASLKEPDIR